MRLLKNAIPVIISIATIIFIYCRYKSILESQSVKNFIFEEMVMVHSKYGGSFELPPEIVLSDSLSDQVQLKSIIKSGPKLVFRFTSLNCDICYKEVLAILKSYKLKLDGKTIILLISFDRINNVRLILRDQNLEFPFFFVPFDSFVSEIENLNYPYFFVLNQNGYSSNIFIPNKEAPELTHRYLNDIISILKQDK